MQTQMQQIKDKSAEIIAKAKILYPHLDLSKVAIRFDLKGKAAGMARSEGYPRRYTIQFNADMLTREAFNHVLNDTTPHEWAHIICFMDPKLGRDHDHGWYNVCRALGGSGKTRHSEAVVYGKGYTYEYTTTTGQKARLSAQRHNTVQKGGTLRYKGNKGTVNQQCAYSIVGYQGRTLATPIHKTGKAAVNSPASIEAAVRSIPAPIRTGVAIDYRPEVFPKDIGAAIAAFAGLPKAPTKITVTAAHAGESKASISRRIMANGYRDGVGYEAIIAAMMSANGYNRQLARATFKANAHRVNIPDSFGA